VEPVVIGDVANDHGVLSTEEVANSPTRRVDCRMEVRASSVGPPFLMPEQIEGLVHRHPLRPNGEKCKEHPAGAPQPRGYLAPIDEDSDPSEEPYLHGAMVGPAVCGVEGNIEDAELGWRGGRSGGG